MTEVRQAHFGLDVARRFTETCERRLDGLVMVTHRYRMLARDRMLQALVRFNGR
jgi:hypothetical protein